MTIHRRTKMNLKIAPLIGVSTTVSSVAIAVPLALHESSQNKWNPNEFICSKYSKQEIANFRKQNEPKTEYVTFDMTRNSVSPKTLLTNHQKFLLLAQINQSSHELMQFVNHNKQNIKDVYKHVYNANSLDTQNNQVSCIDVAQNIQTLPEYLKSFSNNLKNKITHLQDSVSTLLSIDPKIVNSSLYQEIRYWFDINYYYSYGEDLNGLQNRLNNWLGVFQGIDQTGQNIDQSADAMEDTGNDVMHTIATISKILGSILEIAGFIGESIIQNILNSVNVAQQEWKGVTTHWLFGFIYVGSSVGKVAWWGA